MRGLHWAPVRTAVVAAVLMMLALQGCSKSPQVLAVELLFDEVPTLQDQGYSYVRSEALAGGFVVLAQQAETTATPGTTPVFWVGDGSAHLVNGKAKLLAPDLDPAPGIVFDLLDPAIFPEFLQGAFADLLAEDAAEAAPNAGSAVRAPESP